MAEITREQAMQELARRELARREGQNQPQGQPSPQTSSVQEFAVPGRPSLADTKQLSFQANTQLANQQQSLLSRILNKALFRTERAGQKAVENAPEIGQVGGGIAGSVLGSRIGAPIRGQAAGATGGRVLGELVQRAFQGSEQPLTTAEQKEVGKDLLKTAGTTAAFELATGGAFAGASKIGQGILGGLLGPKVAERGIQKGFRRLLDPKLFNDRIDKEIATKTGKFLDRLVGTTGSQVKNAVAAQSDNLVPTTGLMTQADELLKKAGAKNLDDLANVTVSPAQLKKAKAVQDIFENTVLSGDEVRECDGISCST